MNYVVSQFEAIKIRFHKFHNHTIEKKFSIKKKST